MAEPLPPPPPAASCPHHPDASARFSCARCAQALCGDCVVMLAGRPICGACKDEELRAMRSGVPELVPVPFFAVGVRKFAILSMCTLGLYQLYWSYQSWKAIRAATGEDLSPLPRAIFCGFTNFSLFGRIADRAGRVGLTPALPPALLAMLILVFSAAGRAQGGMGLFALVAFLPALPMVRLAARLNAAESPDAPRNASIRGAEWLMVAIGAPVFVLAVIGTLFPNGAR